MIESLTGSRKRLDDEDIVVANALADPDEGVVVGKLEHLGATARQAEVRADGVGQLRVGVSAEDRELIVNPTHYRLLHLSPGAPRVFCVLP